VDPKIDYVFNRSQPNHSVLSYLISVRTYSCLVALKSMLILFIITPIYLKSHVPGLFLEKRKFDVFSYLFMRALCFIEE
jgi:hypothetical protein